MQRARERLQPRVRRGAVSFEPEGGPALAVWPDTDRGEARAAPRPLAGGLILAAFTASGAAGLIYQVVWQSQLIAVFGNTTQAIGTIVSAFMLGLGLGGLAGGAIAPRLRHPLRLYGAVECAVGALALLVPVGFSLITGVYRSAYDSNSLATITVLRLALCLVTITPVACLMGMTLPLLTRYLVTSLRDAGLRMGALYGANTLGAMAGTLLSGYALIELIGLSATARIAVILNLGAGAAGLLLSLRSPAAVSSQDAEVEEVGARGRADGASLRREGAGRLPSPSPLLIYAATFVSGFVALSLEVLWTRLIAEGTGSQVYNFVVILAIFLLGIGAGGALYRWLGSPRRDNLRALALAFLGVAVTTLVTVPAVDVWIPGLSLARALIILPPTLCMGYAFPLSARLLIRSPAQGARCIGTLYLWNTIGSTLGALAAAFLLAATLGTNASILLVAAADACLALAILVLPRAVRRSAAWRWRVGIALAAAATLAGPLLVVSGSPLLMTRTERYVMSTGLPFIHSEDFESTVDAVGGPPNRSTIFTSGVAMTDITVVTKLMAYIPKIVNPGAQRFLDIAFGMGTTFRSAINLGMHTDVVDLSPTVPWRMPMYYPDAEQYLHSPLARIVTADGDNYVRFTSRRYDIIACDPPPPADSAGAAVLYSREFYAAARRDLRPGGVMLQWIVWGHQDLAQFKAQLRTFSSVFPHVVVLLSPMNNGVYLLGADQPITWDPAVADRILGSPRAVADLAGAPDAARLPVETPAQLLDGMILLQSFQVAGFVGPGPLITDDHPITEYYYLQVLFPGAHDPPMSAGLLRRLTG
jgi:spermidine synthase